MISFLLPSLFFPSVAAVNNGLARTPQLGWNNWNSMKCDVSESLLIDTSARLVSSGLRDLGYNYVVLDDCWSAGRDSDGYIQADKEKFPHGMKWVAKQMHDQHLKFGMYSSAGEMTCAQYEGSLDHERKDAESWASWDVDYLKYDNCYHRGRFGYPEVSFNRYNSMWKALNATGRPILYSLCNWGEDSVHTWGTSIANSWRISGDIYDSFARPDDLCTCVDASSPLCIAPGSHCSVLNIVNRVAPFVDRSQPGGWNDLDMLEVGHGGMSDDEYVAHFSLWAALKSPLLIGADIRKLDAPTLSILNNPAVIAVNQDPLGRSAVRIARNLNVSKDKYGIGETQVWSGPLAGNDQLVLFLNAADQSMSLTINLAEIFVAKGPGGSAPQVKEAWAVHDLWANRMESHLAESILNAKESELEGIFKRVGWYNSTERSYAEGLRDADPRLLGKRVGEIEAGGELDVDVPRHAVKMFRLRSLTGSSQRGTLYKDEL